MLRSLFTCLAIICSISETFGCSCDQQRARSLQNELKVLKKMFETERSNRRGNNDALRRELQGAIKLSEFERCHSEDKIRQDIHVGDKYLEVAIRTLQEKMKQLTIEGTVLQEKVEKLISEGMERRDGGFGGGSGVRAGTDGPQEVTAKSPHRDTTKSPHGAVTNSPQEEQTNSSNREQTNRPQGRDTNTTQGSVTNGPQGTDTNINSAQVAKTNRPQREWTNTTNKPQEVGTNSQQGERTYTPQCSCDQQLTSLQNEVNDLTQSFHTDIIKRRVSEDAFVKEIQNAIRVTQLKRGEKEAVLRQELHLGDKYLEAEIRNLQNKVEQLTNEGRILRDKVEILIREGTKRKSDEKTETDGPQRPAGMKNVSMTGQNSAKREVFNLTAGIAKIIKVWKAHTIKNAVTVTKTDEGVTTEIPMDSTKSVEKVEVTNIFLSESEMATTTPPSIATCENPIVSDDTEARHIIVKYLNKSIDGISSFPRGARLLIRCQYHSRFIMTGSNIVTCDANGWSSPLPTCSNKDTDGNRVAIMGMTIKHGSETVYNCEDEPRYSTTCSVTDLGVYRIRSNISMDLSCIHYSMHPTAIYKDDEKMNLLSTDDPNYITLSIPSTSARDSGRYSCTYGNKTMSIDILIIDKV